MALLFCRQHFSSSSKGAGGTPGFSAKTHNELEDRVCIYGEAAECCLRVKVLADGEVTCREGGLWLGARML